MGKEVLHRIVTNDGAGIKNAATIGLYLEIETKY